MTGRIQFHNPMTKRRVLAGSGNREYTDLGPKRQE